MKNVYRQELIRTTSKPIKMYEGKYEWYIKIHILSNYASDEESEEYIKLSYDLSKTDFLERYPDDILYWNLLFPNEKLDTSRINVKAQTYTEHAAGAPSLYVKHWNKTLTLDNTETSKIIRRQKIRRPKIGDNYGR